MKRTWLILTSAFGLMIALPVLGDDPPADAGPRVRIELMNGKAEEGVLLESGDKYVLKKNQWMTVTFRKGEVRRVTPLSDASTAGTPDVVATTTPGAKARTISQKEIEAILGQDLDADDVTVAADPMQPVDLDEESVQQMERIAGPDRAKRYKTDHFILVHTSTPEKAAQLGSRLESVYQWCVRWHEMLRVPARPPKAKLEVFFFGTHKEYMDYQAVNGMSEIQAIGFYNPSNNRSAFFDMIDYPPFRQQLEAARNADFQTRRRIQNLIKADTDHYNLEVIQHEAAHHIHFNIGTFPRRGDLNRWVVEGLAQMFEVPPGEAGGSLGALNHSRISEFRRIYTQPERMDLRTFIVDDRLWQGGASYSLGWSLHQYLWARHRDGYAKYMRLMSEREDDVSISMTQKQKEFEDLFGPVDEEWVKKWADYMNGLQFRPSLAER